ncbi:XRE family transcriptional regulator [Jiangella rhizosphaerae]|uniref:XRE family transcriptional regulator n=2 Tax=Jiangella rhizosphaerae TaxID=2293569 RepID=A0A418KX45_9ACTN|nr:XRE family transcriptional regulator [Jiangella rhizosphaerae]
MPGDPVQIGADDAPWVVTNTYTSTDPWVKLQHSERTHELRSVRVRVLVNHQRAIAQGNGAGPRNVLAARLRELRVERSLTQTELATLSGVKPASLLNIEGGRRTVTLDTIYDLAAALDVPVADLFRPPAPGDPAQ